MRIGIIDDHLLFTEGLSSALSLRKEVGQIHVLNDPHLAERWLAEKRPELVILDLVMPGRSGIDLIPVLLTAGVRVLVVTSRSDREMMRLCMASGAHGFCSKNTPVDELVRAMAAIMKGDTYVCGQMNGQSEAHADDKGLTQREKEVVRLLVKGYSSQRIADELFVTKHTVDTHRKRMLRKFGASSTTELINMLVMSGTDLTG